jgi:hypothetical protein
MTAARVVAGSRRTIESGIGITNDLDVAESGA